MSEQSDRWKQARRIALQNLKNLGAEEDARITAAALDDPDAQPVDGLVRKRGRPFVERPKEKISLRLDPEVIDHFRATGAGWQTRMNDALRRAAGLKKAG